MPTKGRSKGKYCQAVRLLKILDELRARASGALLSDLAEELAVSERQIRRDLEAIEQAGYAVQWELEERRSRVRLQEGRGGFIRLSIRERYVLLAARRVFDVLVHTPFHEDVRGVYGKVVASLPEQDRRDMETIGDRFVYLPEWGVKVYRRKEDVINGLLTGILRRWRVRFEYQIPDGPKIGGALEPYAMVLYKHGLYVVGRPLRPAEGDAANLVAQDPRVYAVERFISAEHRRKDTFEVPHDFRVEHFFDGAFGIFTGGEPQRVVIDFAPEARTLIETRRWHPTQKLTRRRDGWVRLRMQVANPTEVVPWVLGWGPLARVREPANLVERVRDELRRAGAAYG
jgi:predicted DNA-binding transcriptional regulator YafY